MGLTKTSVGIRAAGSGLSIEKRCPSDRIIALAGNPNVGKSTLFNSLTGMNQHTGNWPGKTVTNAQGYCCDGKASYILVDIPGTYSLMAHSAEEEVARNFICFGGADAVAVVCDATCLERNLNLVLQTAEICDSTVLCINLMDEAKRKGIKINAQLLSDRLGIPVVTTVARKKRTLDGFLKTADSACSNPHRPSYTVTYPDEIEAAVSAVEAHIKPICDGKINSRWLSLRLIENDPAFLAEAEKYLGTRFAENTDLCAAVSDARAKLINQGYTPDKFEDAIVSSLVSAAQDICRGAVILPKGEYSAGDRRVDRLLTGRLTGYPLMLLLLALIFWLTITGANYPSELLGKLLFSFQDVLDLLFIRAGAPEWLRGIAVSGAYRVLAWVVSVMLPPMAIFFPLFTLLEDSGYLPRIAYNLDKPFNRCNACGKQALTMCMGFGCNAAGVVGCRIIDSPRERLLAVLTNNFVPCNGRFPLLIAMISMFFIMPHAGVLSSMLPALLLTAVILVGIAATFGVTKLLSVSLLKGVPSSFTLEMPPYRRPQIGRVIVRSVFDRTLFVLGRAAAVAAPAGALIWLAANIRISDASVLSICADFLDPFARLMGLDGVILIAFILGFPANEIVIPIILMAYLAQGSLPEMGTYSAMRAIFVANGWTPLTAACTMLFSLMHWPCSTTLLTVHKETGSIKWTVLAAVIPTAIGILLCMALTAIVNIFA